MPQAPHTSLWKSTATDAPSIAPPIVASSPENTHFSPNIGHIVLYMIIISIIIGIIAYINICMSRLTLATAVTDNTPHGNDNASQNGVKIVKTMTPEERKCYVSNLLKTQKFVGDDGYRDVSTVSFRVTTNSDAELYDLESSISSTITVLSEKPSPSCAICLDRFKNGDDICFAQNKECPHEFHFDCLFPWLLKSQVCPCCRRDYLNIAPTGNSLRADET